MCVCVCACVRVRACACVCLCPYRSSEHDPLASSRQLLEVNWYMTRTVLPVNTDKNSEPKAHKEPPRDVDTNHIPYIYIIVTIYLHSS